MYEIHMIRIKKCMQEKQIKKYKVNVKKEQTESFM